MEIPYKPELPEKARPICMIGAGGIVNDAHLPAYQQAGFDVVSIWNRTPDKAQALAAKFGIPQVFTSLDEQIAAAPADAVFDIAITAAQFPWALEKLPDGAAVLIQKPMGESLAQAREIAEICRRKNLVAAINCQLRFAPFTMAARWMIDQGLIGEVYDMEVRLSINTPWHLIPFLEGHPRLEILYHSVHHIDLLRSFLGDPTSVMAKTLRHPAKTLSSTRSSILLDYGDTLRAAVSTNHDHAFGAQHQESIIKWEGTKGAIKAKMGLLMNYPHGVPDCFEFCLLEDGKEPAWQQVKLEGSWFPEAFVGTMSSLMRYLEGSETSLPTRVEDILKTMAVVEAAYESSSKGGVVPAYAHA